MNLCPCIPSRLISRFKHLTSTISYFNLALTIELSSSSYYSSCASSSKQHLFSCSSLPASTQATCSYYQVGCWASTLFLGRQIRFVCPSHAISNPTLLQVYFTSLWLLSSCPQDCKNIIRGCHSKNPAVLSSLKA